MQRFVICKMQQKYLTILKKSDIIYKNVQFCLQYKSLQLNINHCESECCLWIIAVKK